MEVKCRICGKKIDRDKAYCVPKFVERKISGTKMIKQVNTYYCSKEEYEHFLYEKTIKEQLEKELDILVTSFIGETHNTILYKEKQLWGNDIKKIISFLKDNESNISRAMAKDFTDKNGKPSEYAKIRYFSAIIKNGINDYKDPEPEVIKQTNDEFYESKYVPRKRRKCLSDYEDGDSV